MYTVDKGQTLAQYPTVQLLQSLHLKEKAESTTPSESIVSTETETGSPWLTGYQTSHKKGCTVLVSLNMKTSLNSYEV